MSSLALITGASSGIGAAVAAHAHDQGAFVATINRRPAGDAHLAADLADPSAWPAAARWVDDQIAARSWDRVTMFNCAAVIEPIGFAGEVDSDGYTANVLLNSAMPQVIGAAFLGSMAAHDAAGVLIQISSGAATTVYEGFSSYCGAKAAIDHWSRTAGAEQARRGRPVTVLSIAPGVVATAMQVAIRGSDENDLPSLDRFMSLHEEGVLEDPADVAARLWNVALRDDLENGAVLDLRKI